MREFLLLVLLQMCATLAPSQISLKPNQRAKLLESLMRQNIKRPLSVQDTEIQKVTRATNRFIDGENTDLVLCIYNET